MSDAPEIDYRTGPQKLFAALRGELLGPVESRWPDGHGGQLQFFHKVPNGAEAERITTAMGPRREEQGFSMELILRARNRVGELIFHEKELQMIRTQFPPDDVAELCMAMRNEVDKVTAKVTDEQLGKRSAKTPDSGTSSSSPNDAD